MLTELRRFLDTNPDVRVHFPVEVRFVAADEIYLSPAYGRDSCYINIIMYRPFGKHVPFKSWWNAYEKIVREAGGRPHWAKVRQSYLCPDFVLTLPLIPTHSLLIGSLRNGSRIRKNVSIFQSLGSGQEETGSDQHIFQRLHDSNLFLVPQRLTSCSTRNEEMSEEIKRCDTKM